MDVINAEQDKPPNDQGQMDTGATVVCDFIPICIDIDKMVDHKQVSMEIKQIAPKNNQAVDFEANLIRKKIKNVAIFSVVYRHDNVPE